MSVVVMVDIFGKLEYQVQKLRNFHRITLIFIEIRFLAYELFRIFAKISLISLSIFENISNFSENPEKFA